MKNLTDVVVLEAAAKRVVEEKECQLKEFEIDTFDKWMYLYGRYESSSGWFSDHGKNDWNWAAIALLFAAELAADNNQA